MSQYDFNKVLQDANEKYCPEINDAIYYAALTASTALIVGASAYHFYRQNKNSFKPTKDIKSTTDINPTSNNLTSLTRVSLPPQAEENNIKINEFSSVT